MQRMHPAFASFLALSADIGGDTLKTQGAGGNTSFKDGAVLWIKASGTWLVDAADRAIMVPVALEPLLDALRHCDPRAERAADFVVEALSPNALRPSIETSLHAVLPQPVIAHFHDVNVIALSALARRATVVAERMQRVPDLVWRLIPYCRPGIPLAREIAFVAADRPDVLVLCNHGIVVCADSVEELKLRIERVGDALRLAEHTTATPDMPALAALAEGTVYRPAPEPRWHATALGDTARERALGGSLYPDHVIFLGTSLGRLSAGVSMSDMLATFTQRDAPAPKVILVEGKGVLIHRTLTAGGAAMVGCLADVVSRLPADEDVIYLTAREEYDLTHWEAEHYRQSLDRAALRS